MVKVLSNPKTPNYNEIKEHVLSYDFPWFWNSKSGVNFDDKNSTYVNIPFYSHGFLIRPEYSFSKIPKINSNLTEDVSKVFLEILEFNNIKVNSFLRINANCVHPYEKVVNTHVHKDHNYEHNNCIIYLTGSGGNTIVSDQIHNPKEDDVIVFGGEEHYCQTPEKNRRIVLVSTFI